MGLLAWAVLAGRVGLGLIAFVLVVTFLGVLKESLNSYSVGQRFDDAGTGAHEKDWHNQLAVDGGGRDDEIRTDEEKYSHNADEASSDVPSGGLRSSRVGRNGKNGSTSRASLATDMGDALSRGVNASGSAHSGLGGGEGVDEVLLQPRKSSKGMIASAHSTITQLVQLSSPAVVERGITDNEQYAVDSTDDADGNDDTEKNIRHSSGNVEGGAVRASSKSDASYIERPDRMVGAIKEPQSARLSSQSADAVDVESVARGRMMGVEEAKTQVDQICADDDVSEGDIDWARLLGVLAVLGAAWYWLMFHRHSSVENLHVAATRAWILGVWHMLFALIDQIKSQIDLGAGVEFMSNATTSVKVSAVLAPLEHLLHLHTGDASLLDFDVGVVFSQLGMSTRLSIALSLITATVLMLASVRLLWAQLPPCPWLKPLARTTRGAHHSTHASQIADTNLSGAADVVAHARTDVRVGSSAILECSGGEILTTARAESLLTEAPSPDEREANHRDADAKHNHSTQHTPTYVQSDASSARPQFDGSITPTISLRQQLDPSITASPAAVPQVCAGVAASLEFLLSHSWDATCLQALNLLIHSAHSEGVLDEERCSALLSLCDGKKRLLRPVESGISVGRTAVHNDIRQQLREHMRQ